MTDVCLVQMPYALVNRPSLGLSLLESYLASAGIRTEIVYANLLFAEEIGFDVYRAVEESPPQDLLGEWTFAEAAFGAVQSDDEAYFRLAAAIFVDPHVKVLLRFHPDVDLKELFLLVRRSAVEFVDRLARQLLADSPRIVGCTSMFHQQVASLALLRRVRELAPDVITMLGGANCEGPMGRATVELFPWVDYAASGESDAYIGDFCRRLLDEGHPRRAADLPYGVFGRSEGVRNGAAVPLGTGRRHVIPPAGSSKEPGGAPEAPRAMVANLDETAIPRFDEYFEALSASPLNEYVTTTLPLETSRGCWWGQAHHCTFCGLSDLGIAFRSKSPDRVVDEMRYLSERHGVRRFETADEILDMAFLKSVLPRLVERIAQGEEPYAIFYEVKSNLKREQLELLASAGVREVQPGIESLHDESLKLIDKGNNGLMNVQFLKWSAELGIRVGWNFLFGAPGESDSWYQEIAERVPLLHHLQPPGCTSRIGYHRFSPYHDDPARFGIRLDPRRAYHYVYPVSSRDLENLAYYFEDYTDYFRGQIDPTLQGDQRSGLEAAWAAIKDWRKAHYDSVGGTPSLLAETDGEGLLVRDSRLVATAAEHLLDPRTAAVLRLCRVASTEASLVRRIEGELGYDLPQSELRAVLADLIDRKLIMRDGDRCLSLVLEQLRPLPTHAESAGGELRTIEYARDHAESSLAVTCYRLPETVTVRELFSAP